MRYGCVFQTENIDHKNFENVLKSLWFTINLAKMAPVDTKKPVRWGDEDEEAEVI
jgi:hypothetical protein